MAMYRRPAVPPASRARSCFGGAQLGQQRVGQLQQAQPGAGEAYRLGLAHEQLHAQALFQFLELVRQRRLGKVQALGGFHQAIGFAQRAGS